MCECACTCLYAPGKCGGANSRLWDGITLTLTLESGWWSLSGIQPGQGLLCNGTVRADEADRRNKACSAGPLLLPLDDEIYVAIRGITTQSINSD